MTSCEWNIKPEITQDQFQKIIDKSNWDDRIIKISVFRLDKEIIAAVYELKDNIRLGCKSNELSIIFDNKLNISEEDIVELKEYFLNKISILLDINLEMENEDRDLVPIIEGINLLKMLNPIFIKELTRIIPQNHSINVQAINFIIGSHEKENDEPHLALIYQTPIDLSNKKLSVVTNLEINKVIEIIKNIGYYD
jgi:hypothetical protein